MKHMIAKFVSTWRALARDESGATAIEYGLLASLIALGIVTGATALGKGLDTLFTTVAGKLG